MSLRWQVFELIEEFSFVLNISVGDCNLALVGFSGWGHSFGWLDEVSGFQDVLLLDSLFKGNLSPVDEIDAALSGVDSGLLLVGWSLGGMLALEYACRRPERVAGVISIASCACFTGEDTSLYASSSQELRAFRNHYKKNPAELALRFMERVHRDSPEAVKLDCLVEEFLARPQSRMINQLDFLQSSDLSEELPNLDVPLLLVHGRRDVVIPIESSENIASQVKQSEVNFYPDSGHGIVYDSLPELSLRISSFVSNLTNTGK